MSAAATAAGYLYASGRLRSRASRADEAAVPEQPASRQEERAPRRETLPRREALARRGEAPARRKEPLVGRIAPETRAPLPRRGNAAGETERARPAPRVEYRTRRWRPEI